LKVVQAHPAEEKRTPKLKYRTAADIVADADGLEVPNVLKSIIDATGKETKLLTSASGLMTPTEGFQSRIPSL
jgi:tuftelin-interacting protein 11